MNEKIEKLIEEYFPDNKIAAESFLWIFVSALNNEIQKYGDSQYRKYLSTHKTDDWYLGTSEGADKCIEIIKNMLDK